MDPITLSSIFGIGSKLIDKLFPDPAEKAKAQLELLKMQQQGDLDEIKTQLSAIIAEAQSSDPWTSRARPSFLYVVYILLLWSIPMGVLAIFNPGAAATFTVGFKGWRIARAVHALCRTTRRPGLRWMRQSVASTAWRAPR